jgi:hypothetical protein
MGVFEMSNRTIVFCVIGVVLLGFGGCTWGTYSTIVKDEKNVTYQDDIIDVEISTLHRNSPVQAGAVKDFKEAFLKGVSLVTDSKNSGGSLANHMGHAFPSVPPQMWQDYAAKMSSAYEKIAAAQKTKIAMLATLDNHYDQPQYMLAVMLRGRRIDVKEERKKLITSTGARESRESGVLDGVDPLNPNSGKK